MNARSSQGSGVFLSPVTIFDVDLSGYATRSLGSGYCLLSLDSEATHGKIGVAIAVRVTLNSIYRSPFTNQDKVGQEMGAILDLVEKMRSPMGIVVTIAIIAVGVFFIRWVFADDKEQQ